MKKRIKDNLKISGTYVERYILLYIILISLIIFFELIMMIRGIILFDFRKIKHTLYYSSYIFLFVISVVALILLILKRKGILSKQIMGILVHVYCFSTIAWATFVSALDSQNDNLPWVYLTVIVTIGGLLLVDTIFFTISVLLSYAIYMAIALNFGAKSLFESGNLINTSVLLVMAFVMCFKNYMVSVKEFKIRDKLRKLSYRDYLTGLGNETSYYEAVDKANEQIKNKSENLAVIVLDVNNVKATNDLYGHRSGCNLIVTAGKTLPTIFKTSELFHIGGDEFVCIIYGADYKDLDNKLKKLEEKLEYDVVNFEGHDTILSVAYGYKIFTDEASYNDVYQKADENMYINKEKIKEKYNLSER